MLLADPPGLIAADMPALLRTADQLATVATDIAAVGAALRTEPTFGAAVYGWNGTADAMASVVSCWTVEVRMLQQAMDELSTMVHSVVENIRWADDRAANRTGMHGW